MSSMDFKKYGVVINRISDSEILFKYSPIPYYKSFYEIAIPVVLEILLLAVELFVFGSAPSAVAVHNDGDVLGYLLSHIKSIRS